MDASTLESTFSSPGAEQRAGLSQEETAIAPRESTPTATVSFLDIYEEHFSFVWRAVRRLGVDVASVDDVVQDVLLTAHRRLSSFESRSSIKTWLFGIVLRVVRDHRRTLRRKGHGEVIDVERIADPSDDNPHESAERAQHRALLHHLLDALDDDKREVFVLAELEQMTAPEIATATDTNVNTVYWRLRAAREAFNQAVARYRASVQRGNR